MGEEEGRDGKLLVLPAEPQLLAAIPSQGVDVATGLGTGFSDCNCLFDYRNCLLTSQGNSHYYKLNCPKMASAVY